MCYDDQARPPVPQGPTSAAGKDIQLTAADGTQFMAYEAMPAAPASARVLVLPDVRGLHQFYKELALRFAEHGMAAIAIDYFGRTAGLGARDESFEFQPHVAQLALPTVFDDVRSALTHLQDQTDAQIVSVAVGFCLGGTLSFLCGTSELGLDAVAGFYSGMSRSFEGYGTLLDQAPNIHLPLLGLFGGADAGIPVEQVHTFDGILNNAGVPHEIVIYDDAPHSFFDRRQSEFAEASADAWQRVVAFIAGRTMRGRPAR